MATCELLEPFIDSAEGRFQQCRIEGPGVDRAIEARRDAQQAPVCAGLACRRVAQPESARLPGLAQEALHELRAHAHCQFHGLPHRGGITVDHLVEEPCLVTLSFEMEFGAATVGVEGLRQRLQSVAHGSGALDQVEQPTQRLGALLQAELQPEQRIPRTPRA
ncbi:hypothetical protein D3C78_1457540 [compost metagenome]